MKLKDLAIFTIISLLIIVSSCKKEDDFLTDSSAKLQFSEDTLIFDTVFTTIGSTTQYLIVYNRNDQPVKVTNIRLASGSSSYFRMNIDGIAGNNQNDVEIRSNDSIFIFVEVTIDPNNQNTPMIVKDSILFNLNGNQQDVDLVAWGQDAHYILPTHHIGLLPYSLIDTNTCATITWDSTKPYVIYGYAVIDSCQTLNIMEGTKIYSYNNGGLWVYHDGNLHVMGSKDHPVVFAGTRLEQSYADVPNQWDRIWINDGGQNTINYAIIKNSFIGIQAETISDNPQPTNLLVNNTIIKNAGFAGIYANAFKVTAYNTVVANCGSYCVWLLVGGDYDFRHCTFANYWSNGTRSTPSVFIGDYYYDQGSQHHAPLNCFFGNSIIYGNIDNEIELDLKYKGSDTFDFYNCLFKVDPDVTNTADPHFHSHTDNVSPNFVDYTINDYHLNSPSPCIDAGSVTVMDTLTTDLDGKPRGGSPDLGAYEK